MDISYEVSFCYEEAYEMQARVNAKRKEAGVLPLQVKDEMMDLAMKRAAESALYWSHTRPDGTSCFTAVTEKGIRYRYIGENIAYGQRNPEEVMNAWMNSPGHRGKILDPGFGRLGVACYYDPGSSYGFYWVQLFAD